MNHELTLIMDSRPPADHDIEQFLMTPKSVELQLRLVGPFLQDQSVFFLGDDDHVSPLLALEYGSKPYVYEYDERVRVNLGNWFEYFNLRNAAIHAYDVRNRVNPSPNCDSFYINPPYSAKSEGLGIKIWLMRAMEACVDHCKGVIVMPRTKKIFQLSGLKLLNGRSTSLSWQMASKFYVSMRVLANMIPQMIKT